MFSFISDWKKTGKNSWKKMYDGHVTGIVVKVGRKKYDLSVAYQKNNHKFFITEVSSYYCDEYEAQNHCDRIVDDLNSDKL